MKSLFSLFVILAAATTASATGKDNVAICWGEHHGTYVDILKAADGSIVLETSTDGEADDAEVDANESTYRITKITGTHEPDDVKLPSEYENEIRGAIEESFKEGIPEGGMIIVEARSLSGQNTLVLNINSFLKKDHLVLNNVVEDMNCAFP